MNHNLVKTESKLSQNWVKTELTLSYIESKMRQNNQIETKLKQNWDKIKTKIRQNESKSIQNYKKMSQTE